MESVNIRIRPLVFDQADYDEAGDVLYLRVGPPELVRGRRRRMDTWFGSLLGHSESSG